MNTPLATAVTNTTENSVVKVAVKPEPMLFFRPETCEMIAVPRSDITAFQLEYRRLNKVMADYLFANQDCQALAEQLAAVDRRRDLVGLQVLEHKLAVAENHQIETHATLREELKALSELGGAGKELVELIPIPRKSGLSQTTTDKAKREVTAGAGLKDSWKSEERIVYVRSDKIKTGWPSFKAPAKDVKLSAILTKDAHGRHKIDETKLREFAKQATKKIKYAPDFIDFDEHKVEGILYGWAEQWNRDLHASGKGKLGYFENNVALDSEAQLMRYLSGVGVSGTFEPFKKHVAFKAEGKAEFSVAEAKATARLHLPDRDGWMWAIDGEKGKEFDLGAVRLEAKLELCGGAGASAVAEIGLKVEHENDHFPMVKGTPGTRRNKRKKVKIGKSDGMVVAGASAELNVFMGVQADAKLAGAIQWRNPETEGKDFKDFAKIAPGVGGLGGMGGGAQLKVDYANGKFRLRAAASICLGVGAKGALELEVDADLFVEFFRWFFYQLYHANFTRLNIFTDVAFITAKHIQFLAINGGKRTEDYIDYSFEELDRLMRIGMNSLKDANGRALLANRILNNSAMLKYAIPETKGMVLYQLTRYNNLELSDPRNHSLFETFGRRKEAVKRIFDWAHTRPDCDNMIEHMTRNGTKGSYTANFDHIMRFFEIGPGDSRYDSDFLVYYSKLQARLKDEPTRGYEVAMNTSELYADQKAQGEDHVIFASAGVHAYYA